MKGKAGKEKKMGQKRGKKREKERLQTLAVTQTVAGLLSVQVILGSKVLFHVTSIK